jgi:glycosyltransferase involved in cell wall biosynthesis
LKIAYLMQEGAPDLRRSPLDGPGNHVRHVFRELQGLGHHVELLVCYDGRIWESQDLEFFEPVDVPRSRLESPVRGIQSRLRLPYLALFESRLFARACAAKFAGFDLMYERMGWMGYGGGLAARRLGVPLVLEVNNGDFITELERRGVAPTGFQKWLAIELMRRSILRARHVVATGDGHRRRFVEWWKTDPARVSVVENGSEVIRLLPRNRLRCFQPGTAESEGVTVVFVGAFEAWHGIPNLVRAMSGVVAKHPAAQLVLVGSGSERDRIVRLVRQLHLEDRVKLTGHLEMRNVAECLAQADIGVAPYSGWMEFSGLKLFDYKSAGLAIVASGAGGQPSTLKDGHTGLIVPPGDEEALGAAILRLVSDAPMRRKMGQAARLEAEQSHGWNHTARRLEQIFTAVVGRRENAVRPSASHALGQA